MSVFREKICIVTGGGSGLGRALCRQLAEQGAILTVADLNKEAAYMVAREITDEGGKAVAAPVDVTIPESVESLVNQTLERYGRIDYMFNNAGVAVLGEFRDLPLAEVKKVLNVNLSGVLHGSYTAFRVMARQGFGHIVNTASGFGLAPGPTNLPYVTSKFGVVGLSETLRVEGLDLGVKVSTVCPGYIRTSLVEHVRTYRADARDVLSTLPVRLVEPEEAARLVLRKVGKNRAIIAFPSYVGLLTFLYRFVPGLFLRYSLRTVREFRKFRKPDLDGGESDG
ncbi:SDR family oxidoreductase [Paenibacillus mesophilus]|uniref:SDR family NAD(P)-dependent oxidoreductase n=1 Tax=Paenibacillus mesophilus TaxID=2582849 RepID=UPI00110D4AD4|nr:SDR family oxidoreductase [Paenibacillus mesophilus]TMV48674.1 SDR family oxidoreductase [Paenibacillus mesophilus]